MGDDDSDSAGTPDVTPPAGEASEGFLQRQGDMEWRPVESGIDTSPEALDILRTKGAKAWREWVAKEKAKTDDQA